MSQNQTKGLKIDARMIAMQNLTVSVSMQLHELRAVVNSDSGLSESLTSALEELAVKGYQLGLRYLFFFLILSSFFVSLYDIVHYYGTSLVVVRVAALAFPKEAGSGGLAHSISDICSSFRS